MLYGCKASKYSCCCVMKDARNYKPEAVSFTSTLQSSLLITCVYAKICSQKDVGNCCCCYCVFALLRGLALTIHIHLHTEGYRLQQKTPSPGPNNGNLTLHSGRLRASSQADLWGTYQLIL